MTVRGPHVRAGSHQPTTRPTVPGLSARVKECRAEQPCTRQACITRARPVKSSRPEGCEVAVEAHTPPGAVAIHYREATVSNRRRRA